jgi:hypothetical protein
MDARGAPTTGRRPTVVGADQVARSRLEAGHHRQLATIFRFIPVMDKIKVWGPAGRPRTRPEAAAGVLATRSAWPSHTPDRP